MTWDRRGTRRLGLSVTLVLLGVMNPLNEPL